MSYAIGIDYGTESGRVLILNLETGEEMATVTVAYASGVIDHVFPPNGAALPTDYALQDPADYLAVLTQGVPAALRQSGVSAAEVIGLGIDFTSCTVMPTTGTGTPLCKMDPWAMRPHAWPKLWKHHAAQSWADRINEEAVRTHEEFLSHYGGRISSEWYFPKLLEIFAEDRAVYDQSAAFVEASDWVVWQLTGNLARNTCAAGYKAMRGETGLLPNPALFTSIHPEFTDPERLLGQEFYPAGTRAGYLTPEWAELLELTTGTAIAVGNVDAHASVPGAGIGGPGQFVMVLGTSICHLAMTPQLALIPGITGVVKDGVLPGYYGYEAGQAAVGDMLAWFVHESVPRHYQDQASRHGRSVYEELEAQGARLLPGQSGLIALDWWNGNRSILGDADLGGLVVGLTLTTQAPDIYRALLESIAFGTRRILDNFAQFGVTFERLVACGGLSHKSPLLMQLYADICDLPVAVPATKEMASRGAALFGAVAAGGPCGGFSSIEEAIAKLPPPISARYLPDPSQVQAYQPIYGIYRTLYEYLGRDHVDLMHDLKQIRLRAVEQAQVDAPRRSPQAEPTARG